MTPTKVAYWRLVNEIVDGDKNALKFIAQLNNASEVYRLASLRKPQDNKQVTETIMGIISEWMVNPFIKQNSEILSASIKVAEQKYLSDPNAPYCPVDTDLINMVCIICNKNPEDYMHKIKELSNQLMKERNEREN
jgi:hypothetical protein